MEGKQLEARDRQLPNIVTGEIVNLADTEQAVRYLADLKEHERDLKTLIGVVQDAVLEHAASLGTKTLHFGKIEAKVTGGPQLEWDVEVLEELRAAGLPDERFAELVSIEQTFKVNARVAAQLERSGNETYAEIIERARSYAERPRRVSVRSS